MVKAQASFLDFLLATLFSVMVLISIFSISFSLYQKWLREEIKKELNYLSTEISREIIKAYSEAGKSSYIPENYSSFLIYEKDLELPRSLKGRNYEVYLVNPNPIWVTITNISVGSKEIEASIETGGIKIIARTLQSPEIEVEFSVPNVNIIAEGKVINGENSKLRYYRLNLNGEILEVAVLGNYNILAKITNIR